jgi:hypothetical protein
MGGCEWFVRKRLMLMPSLGRMALPVLGETVVLVSWVACLD